MGARILQQLLENDKFPGCLVPVSLLDQAKKVKETLTTHQKKTGLHPKYVLVVDGECCLDRLYGGAYSDWVCGGQWNRMISFITSLKQALTANNIDMVVFFNGCVEPQRLEEWTKKQWEEDKKIVQALRHINNKGTQPPAVLWVAPVGVRMALRTILRHVNVSVVSTMDDHHQEVIAYIRENSCDGLIADDAEYIAFDPPRLFSGKHFKLKYKGGLTSMEYMIPELKKILNLTTEKLCILIALLGNYLLPEGELKEVHERITSQIAEESRSEDIVIKLAKYLNQVNSTDNVDEFVNELFGSNESSAQKLKQSIQYYLDGTEDGFLKYRSSANGNKKHAKGKRSKNVTTDEANLDEQDLDPNRLVNENPDDEPELKFFQERPACLVVGGPSSLTVECSTSELNGSYDHSDNGGPSSLSSPVVETSTEVAGGSSQKLKDAKQPPVLPPVAHEIMRTASERHSKGLMSPLIYQILSQGEIKLPVLMENFKEIPSIYEFYKPIRQRVYAVIFNLYHHRFLARNSKDSSKAAKESAVDIRIKEYIWNKNFSLNKVNYVKAEPVGWAVPTIQRLWFGTTVEDKRRRLRAFLSCMRSDCTLILNPDFVPQHMLIAATVLRYMMSADKPVLRKPDLDAFICTALSPQLVDCDSTQKIEVPFISSRGVQLAAMFMHGLEMAILVNDACGSPIPWLMCCPWLFFDGRLFQQIYCRAGSVKNLHELCNGNVEMIMTADRIKKAILEGIDVRFARPAPFRFGAGDTARSYNRHQTFGASSLSGSPMSNVSQSARGFGTLGGGGSRYGRPLETGGQLEVAGVVVGSWGPNYHLNGTPFGNNSGYSGMQSSYLQSQADVGIGGGYGGMPSLGYRGKGRAANKFAKKKQAKKPAGRGLTVADPFGNSIPADNLDFNGSGCSSGIRNGSAGASEHEQFEDAIGGNFNGV